MKASKPPAPPSLSIAQKLRAAVRTVFYGQLRFKRTDDKKLKVTWGETPTTSKAGAKPSTQSAPFGASTRPGVQGADDGAEVERMRAELTAALNARPNNRVALPHLAALEQHLKSAGLKVFERAPLVLLSKAHEQLLLLSNGHQELQRGALMSTLSDTITRRGQDVTVVDDVAWRPARDSDLMVTEGSMSDFMLVDKTSNTPDSPGKPPR